MKINCTKEEKEWLVVSIMTSEEPCRFETTGSYTNCKNCRECLNKNIEWEIKDCEQNG